MTLGNASLKVGIKCQLTDSSGNFVDGNVTASNVYSFLNDRHRQLYLKLISKFPFLGELNEELDLEDGESFYSFEDLTEDLLVPSYLGIKYASTDTDYTRVLRKERGLLFKRNTSETNYDKSKPWYTFTRNATGELGIQITPTPDADVTDGLYFEYVLLPEDLSGVDDTFSIPEGLQDVMVAYAIADTWETKRDWGNSNQALNRALLLENEFFANYNPKASDTPVKIGIGKSYNPFSR